MKVKCVGGPYDGEWVDVNLMDNGRPIPFLERPQKSEPKSVLSGGAKSPDTLSSVEYSRRIIVDKQDPLGRVLEWHYEYHY